MAKNWGRLKQTLVAEKFDKGGKDNNTKVSVWKWQQIDDKIPDNYQPKANKQKEEIAMDPFVQDGTDGCWKWCKNNNTSAVVQTFL